jgi:hypothetical protein
MERVSLDFRRQTDRVVYESLRVNREDLYVRFFLLRVFPFNPNLARVSTLFASDEVNTERERAKERGSLCLPSRLLSYICSA